MGLEGESRAGTQRAQDRGEAQAAVVAPRDGSVPAVPFLAVYGRVVWDGLLFLAGLFLLFQTGAIHSRAGSTELGPVFWPRFWLAILLALVASDAWAAYRRARLALAAAGPPGVPARASSGIERPPESIRLLLAGGALVLAYVVGAIVFGFMLATPLYLFAFAFLGGFRRILPLALIAVATTAAFLFLFVRVVYVSLPLGTGPFADFTASVYQAVGLF